MEQFGRTRATYKRIIVCVDGTWLGSNLGRKEKPSNVTSIARAIAPTGINEHGEVVQQITLYHTGLAAGNLPGQKALYGAFGWGLELDVCQLYDFIAKNYEPNDELFFFGFSRGAFTVRSVAGLISDIGLIAPKDMEQFPDVWESYRKGKEMGPHLKYMKYKDVEIKFVGVWDTVGELVSADPEEENISLWATVMVSFPVSHDDTGLPNYWFIKLLKKLGLPINGQYRFHNTKLSDKARHAYGALAIDERRLPFPATLWHEPPYDEKSRVPGTESKTTNLCQCWFPGIHGDIGGQADSYGKKGEIGYNTLEWMIDNTSQMLTYSEEVIQTIVSEHDKLIRTNAEKHEPGWGLGPIAGNFDGIAGKFFLLLGKESRRPGNDLGYRGNDDGIKDKFLRLKDKFLRLLGKESRRPGNDDGTVICATNEVFHPLVRIRQKHLWPHWNPASLAGWHCRGPPWKWTKQDLPRSIWEWWPLSMVWTPPKRNLPKLPEYVMDPKKTMSLAYIDGDQVRYKTGESLSRIMCPKSELIKLHNANGRIRTK